MKTKIKVRQAGCKRHQLWHLIVQGDKKNLKGRYIEHIGYWLPRHGATYKRGVVLNKHKARYWLSVGAEPTPRAARILSMFGFFPAPTTPFGSASLYEKPAKEHHIKHYRDTKKDQRSAALEFRQRLQGEMNRVARERLIQAEAMAAFGESAESRHDVEVLKTDDIESEEADAFKRVEKFNELQKRLD